jgi:hypothetical protein
VKRIALLCTTLFLLAACRSGPNPGSGDAMTGASQARAALDGFLGAIRSQDLQAMSRLWGGEKGLARDRLSRDELEKRELIIMCHMAHDSYDVVTEHPESDRRRTFVVRLKRGRDSRQTTFKTFRSGANRWYVEDADVAAVADFCQNMPGR